MKKTPKRADFSRPVGPVRVGLAVIGLFAGTIAAWSAFAPLSDAAVAAGNLQVQARRQSVQHPYGGVVSSIEVAEGQRVTAGQPLLRLSDVEPKAQLDVLEVEKAALVARQARLRAERDGGVIVLPDWLLQSNSDAAASEQSLYEARRRQHESAREVLARKSAQVEERITGQQAEAEALARQAELLGEELTGASKLLDQGYSTRTRVSGLERELSEVNSALAAKRAQIAAEGQAMAEAQTELARLERERLTAVTEELNNTDRAMAELEPKLSAARDALARTQVEAPASGTVVELAVFTEGGVVRPGDKLMEIVPDDSPFFVEARLKLTELHGIAAGQTARIDLLSMPRSTRPDIDGVVETVSADRIVDDRSGEAFYALQIRLDAADVAAAGVRLQAGMPVQVIMPTQQRTLIDYLTSPLLDEVSGAFREY
jgi:epimerase transport system membrane fusion protein